MSETFLSFLGPHLILLLVKKSDLATSVKVKFLHEKNYLFVLVCN